MAKNDSLGVITYHIEGAHAALTISNPARRNAISLAMWKELSTRVQEADADPSIHLISLRGHNGTFVSGADISEFAKNRADVDRAKAYEAFNGAAFASLREAKTPTLALIEGFCFGGGVGLAAACDIRLAASTARFAVPAAKLGLAYPVDGVRDLVRLIGPGATKRLFFTADPISADVALRIGFVDELVETESFQGSVEQLIATILLRAPLTQRAAKSAIAAALDSSLEAQALADAEACFASDDYAEGWQAFLDKRAPAFKGS